MRPAMSLTVWVLVRLSTSAAISTAWAMVQDHVLHELHIVGRIAVIGYAGCFTALQGPRSLTRRAGLDDGSLLRHRAVGQDQDAGGG